MKRRLGIKDKAEEGPRPTDPKWLEDAVSRLLQANHRFHDIPEYTLPQFVMHLRAVERRDAESRTHFVTDLAAAIGGLFGGGDALSEHLTSLQNVVHEESKNGSAERS